MLYALQCDLSSDVASSRGRGREVGRGIPDCLCYVVLLPCHHCPHSLDLASCLPSLFSVVLVSVCVKLILSPSLPVGYNPTLLLSTFRPRSQLSAWPRAGPRKYLPSFHISCLHTYRESAGAGHVTVLGTGLAYTVFKDPWWIYHSFICSLKCEHIHTGFVTKSPQQSSCSSGLCNFESTVWGQTEPGRWLSGPSDSVRGLSALSVPNPSLLLEVKPGDIRSEGAPWRSLLFWFLALPSVVCFSILQK